MKRKTPEQDDAAYLEMRRNKRAIAEIAEVFGVSERTVKYGIKKAREIADVQARIARAKIRRPDPKAEILFGPSCKPWALTTCADIHPGGPIPEGSDCVCGKCHQYGRDYLPSLRRDPLTDPRLEPKPPAKPLLKETAKQKKAAKKAAKKSKSKQPAKAAA